ncbi:MAG: ABC transporter ATP-binding protein [Microthrixaceae bacterium]|nr:ABC transporter ATP-binding protein [Microthrixaceae bacterium]
MAGATRLRGSGPRPPPRGPAGALLGPVQRAEPGRGQLPRDGHPPEVPAGHRAALPDLRLGAAGRPCPATHRRGVHGRVGIGRAVRPDQPGHARPVGRHHLPPLLPSPAAGVGDRAPVRLRPASRVHGVARTTQVPTRPDRGVRRTGRGGLRLGTGRRAHADPVSVEQLAHARRRRDALVPRAAARRRHALRRRRDRGLPTGGGPSHPTDDRPRGSSVARVVLDGLTKRFGDLQVVDHLSLEIHDREFFVLLGPSGCGKTTVLRMMAGLDAPTSGTITLGDTVVNHLDPRRRDVAMVFQSYALYPHMTVAENIEAPLLGRGGSRREGRAARARQVREAAEILGLGELLGRKPAALSGGQRQRVALARALVRRPQLFLMDEPLSNLDAKLRTRTRLDLVDLWRQLDATIVFVTHDQVEAMTMATRIAVMADGILHQVGAPTDVYDDPDDLFAATFLGSPPINVLEVADLEPSTNGLGPLPTGTTQLGVRPEHLRTVSEDAPAGELALLRGTVRGREALGHEVHVVARVGARDVVARQPAHDATPAPGSPIILGFHPSDALAFDRDGARVR